MKIFVKKKWNGNSGPGSDPRYCIPYLDFLAKYIRDNKIESVLDLGSGDGRLASVTDWGSAVYTGLDIKNGFDITSCDLPDAELVLIKDVLQHWNNESINEFFPRVASYKLVLITNCADDWRTNEDIVIGDCRALDLAKYPFNWPVEEVFRWRGHETKSVVQFSARKPIR